MKAEEGRVVEGEHIDCNCVVLVIPRPDLFGEPGGSLGLQVVGVGLPLRGGGVGQTENRLARSSSAFSQLSSAGL